MKTILLAMFLAVTATGAPTEIRDTGYTGFGGTLFSGRITVTAPDMTTQDGRTVNRWEQSAGVKGHSPLCGLRVRGAGG